MNLTFLRLLRLCKIAKAGEVEVGSIPASINFRENEDFLRDMMNYEIWLVQFVVVLITWPVGISLGGNNMKHWSWPTLRLHWVHSRLSLKIHGLSERMMNIEDLWAMMMNIHQTISNHQLKTDATTILSASSGASCVANSAILPRAAADVGLRPGIRFKCHLAPASVMRYMEVLSVLSCSLLCTILKDMMCCVSSSFLLKTILHFARKAGYEPCNDSSFGNWLDFEVHSHAILRCRLKFESWMDHNDHDVPLRMIFFLTSAEVMFIFSLLLAACLHPDVTVGVALGSGPWGPGLCGLCQVGQGAGIGRLLGRIFQRKRTAKPGGSACRWLWMALGISGMRLAVASCGIFSNLFGVKDVKFRGTNLAGDIMLWYGSVGRDLVMVADLMVILTMATKEVCIELIEVPC